MDTSAVVLVAGFALCVAIIVGLVLRKFVTWLRFLFRQGN